MTLDAAAAQVRGALEALGPAQHSARAGLLVDLGEVLRRAGDTVGARQAFLDAARHARSVGDVALLGEAALGYGLGAGGLHRALRCDLQHIALLEEALAALGPAEVPLRVRLLARLAEELYFTPEWGARATVCGEAVAMARRMQDPAVLLPALHARELGHVGPDVPLVERLAEAAELVSLAEQLGDLEAAYMGRMLRELALIEAGCFGEAEPELDAAERLAEELGMPGLQAWTATARARQHWVAGRFVEAEKENSRALVLALERGGDPEVANLVVGGQLLSFQLLRAELAPFVPSLVAFRSAYPQFTILRCFTAYALADSGQLEPARAELDELGRHGFADVPRTAEWPGTMWALGRCAGRLAEAGAAALLYAELAPCSGRWCADWASTCMGPIDTTLGVLAAVTKAHDVADAHFEGAQAQARAAGSPPWLADAQVEHAAALLRRGGGESRQRAERLLDEALDASEVLGLDALAVRATALLS